MIRKNLVCRFAFCVALAAPAAAWAAHPLITDDTGTQGRGNFQLEVNGEYDHDKQYGITTTGKQADATLTYGIIDTVDVAIGIPYMWINTKSDDRHIDSSVNGFADATLDVKYRFVDMGGFSLAVKPGLNIPTGDSGEGLGAGKWGYHVYMIGTVETGPWTFLANLGYIRNDSDADTDENNIWHVSAAALYSLNNQWKIVGDLVAERNTDKDSDVNPVSAIAGVIYSPTKDIDLDLGIKAGLTSTATDWAFLAGTTFRF
ncbi:MAG: transporter [Desulfocapsaceae bacterium]|nr:transporter [Desulfocapsaceae bacterium]